MKRFSVCLAAILLLFICGTLAGCNAVFPPKEKQAKGLAATEYLRIHVRANDNDAASQAVKYAVKEELTTYLSPLLQAASSKSEALSILKSCLGSGDEIASRVLKEWGFCYRASSRLAAEAFPTRVYDETCLPAGVYDALIVTLGEGAGDNWWCVAYPPLCFLPETGKEENVIYRSAVWDWLKSLFG